MSAPAIPILDAVRDERLFGSAFRDLSTWRAWLAFLAALFGLPMSEDQAEVYRACTGRSALPDGLSPRRGWSAAVAAARASSWR